MRKKSDQKTPHLLDYGNVVKRANLKYEAENLICQKNE